MRSSVSGSCRLEGVASEFSDRQEKGPILFNIFISNVGTKSEICRGNVEIKARYVLSNAELGSFNTALLREEEMDDLQHCNSRNRMYWHLNKY